MTETCQSPPHNKMVRKIVLYGRKNNLESLWGGLVLY
jgi:hypothetical protein